MKSEIETNTYRFIRGGSWYTIARGVRAAFRDWVAPGSRSIDILGFRLVRTVKVDKQIKRWREESEEGLFDGN